jgi:hypothetical protein
VVDDVLESNRTAVQKKLSRFVSILFFFCLYNHSLFYEIIFFFCLLFVSGDSDLFNDLLEDVDAIVERLFDK